MTFQYRAHVSKARASVTVLMADILDKVVEAGFQDKSEDRLESLGEALDATRKIVADLEAAVSMERTIGQRERAQASARPKPRTPEEGVGLAIESILCGRPLFGGEPR